MREYITLKRRVFWEFSDLAQFDTQKGMSIWTVLVDLESKEVGQCSETRRPG
jgi:hypothetical protein